MNATGFQRLKAFGRSPHHAWLALLTLGGSLATLQLPLLGVGAALYGLGWIYLPDSNFFKRWLAARSRGTEDADETRKWQARITAVNKLPPALRAEYKECTDVVSEILMHPSLASSGSVGGADRTVVEAQVEELLGTVLRLLELHARLDHFVRTETSENLAEQIREAENAVAQAKPENTGLGGATRDRIIQSHAERLETLKLRKARLDQAVETLELTKVEQDRVEQALKLLRADLHTSRDPAAWSYRLDADLKQLRDTNRWISEVEIGES